MSNLKGIIYLEDGFKSDPAMVDSLIELRAQFLRIFSRQKSLFNYPWIRSLDHLNRVNKYRKRVVRGN